MKYPLPFYNYFLEKIKTCKNPDELFDCLFTMLHWKLGVVRASATKETGNSVSIGGLTYAWSDLQGDFGKLKTDADFLKQCFSFRDGKIGDTTFYDYMKKRMIFKSGIVLFVFIIHLLRPAQYPMIDKHVWRAMKSLKKEAVQHVVGEPEDWGDYKKYTAFFDLIVSSLKRHDPVQFDISAIDRALMAFGASGVDAQISISQCEFCGKSPAFCRKCTFCSRLACVGCADDSSQLCGSCARIRMMDIYELYEQYLADDRYEEDMDEARADYGFWQID